MRVPILSGDDVDVSERRPTYVSDVVDRFWWVIRRTPGSYNRRFPISRQAGSARKDDKYFLALAGRVFANRLPRLQDDIARTNAFRHWSAEQRTRF